MESTYYLITELCSALAKDLVIKNPERSKFIRQLRSRSFEILLSNRILPIVDPIEDEPVMLLVHITSHIYYQAKARGDWTEEMNEKVHKLMEKIQTLMETNSSIVQVLKLLLLIAGSAPATTSQKPSYGVDMTVLISDDLKHKPLIKYSSLFDPKAFELPNPVELETSDFPDAKMFNAVAGTGLKHHEFFSPPVISTLPSRSHLSLIDKYDFNNANWMFPKLEGLNSEESSNQSISRFVMHQDEGYITPDQDLKTTKEQKALYIPWELISEQKFKPVYSWESFGSCVLKKEPPFLFQEKEAVEHFWKVVNNNNVISHYFTSDPLHLKAVNLEELEKAFKNLLVGVESTIFQYNHSKKSFVLQDGSYLSGSSAIFLEEYCKDFIECGNSFRELSAIIKKENEATSPSEGSLVYKAMCRNVSRILQCYTGIVLRMPPLTNLMQTYDWLYNMHTQLQFLISLCHMKTELPEESLLAKLYEQVLQVNKRDLAFMLYYLVQSCCAVYFQFVEKWIFEGLCSDKHNEFFIGSNSSTETMLNRKFWTRGFLLNRKLVPGFLEGLEEDMFVCGKSVALLKLCAPDDPICLRLKQGHPDIACCLNKIHLDKTKEQCRLYKEECKAHCLQVFGVANTKPEQNEDYYAALRAKSLGKIKQVQEEERLLRSQKQRREFEILKKNMEEAQARKIEDKKMMLEEEERLMEEAMRLDYLNDLRRAEEREKLMKHYSALSETADRRRERAEWKMKRANLHDKRVEFLKEKENVEVLENYEEDVDSRATLESDLTKEDSSENKSEPIGKVYNVNPGSGDYSLHSEKESDLLGAGSDVTDYLAEQLLEINMIHPSTTNENTKVELSSDIGQNVFTSELDDEKRNWLIALDVADKARQCAIKFKERNMFNDYNILTGEVTSYKSRFIDCLKSGDDDNIEVSKENKTTSTNTEDKLQKRDIVIISNSSSLQSKGEMTQTNENNAAIEKMQTEDTVVEVDDATNDSSTEMVSHKGESTHEDETSTNKNKTSTHKDDILTHKDETLTHKEEISTHRDETSTQQKSRLFWSNAVERLGMSSSSTCDLNIDDIDMTTVYHNLRMSVMIPLATQLELANEAVLRLFLDKHNLLKHLECIRKHFFLLDGEFGRNLTRKLFTEIEIVEHPSHLLNFSRLNSLLRLAVGTSVDEEYTERLSFFVNEIPSVFRLIDPKALDCLSMRYQTYWPINVIISDEAIMKCDKVFTFLMQLQRTSWALEQDIYLLKDKRLVDSPQYRQVQLYRHIMTHFVTTLQNYVTSVVLEESWYQFKEEFDKVKTLNEMYGAHVKYIKMLNFRCLLNKRSRQVNKHLMDLFGIILKFHEVLRSGEWAADVTGSYQHSGFSHLTHQFSSFFKMCNFLYPFLERLVGFGYQPHLVQLLTMLSANNFYKSQ